MRKLLTLYDAWSGRAANAAALWPLVPPSLVGVVTGLGSQSVAWISQFGWFGWWCAGLSGFVLSSGAFALIGLAKEKFELAKAQRRWSMRTQGVNPMANAYVSLRIDIRDLAHPITGRITNKSFKDCELFGPENVTFARGVTHGLHFMDCDVVVLKDGAEPRNLKVFDGCTVTGGSLWNCTIFVTRGMYESMSKGVSGQINLVSGIE